MRIKTLVAVLPDKDAVLCDKYLERRDFESILEIVKSDIYKARKNQTEDLPDYYIGQLIELEGELISYMTDLGIFDDSDNNDYDDY